MHAIILAAENGSQNDQFPNKPRCMLRIDGKPVIEHTLDALSEAGITKCIIVTGDNKEAIISLLGAAYKNTHIEYVSNDSPSPAGSMYSLFLVKDYLAQDDTILLDGSVIFEHALIADLISCPGKTAAAVAPWESWMDGTAVVLSEDNEISGFIQRVYRNSVKKEIFKSVNIYKFSKEFSADVYIPFLEAYIRTMDGDDDTEQVLRIIGLVDKFHINAFLLNHYVWREIRGTQDRDIAEILFARTSSEKLRLIFQHQGGLWRFPELLDFCYLTNPYFPTREMKEEIKAHFDMLLKDYPSGQAVQTRLGAELFGVSETNIILGNGTVELIKALSRVLGGTIGIIRPTYNEYSENLSKNGYITLRDWVPENFTYTTRDIEKFSGGYDALVLINPDNPSGHYIPRDGLVKLAAYHKKRQKKLIVDESFVDFTDTEKQPSLITQEILDEFPNLIVLRSLGKSYGITGLRLGLLASGDLDILAEVRGYIPKWNINSFGEYFLQCIGRYKKYYRQSCAWIAAERARFKTELEKTALLTVYPSQANFFLCRINGSANTKEFSEYLLQEHNILINGLDGRPGIPEDKFFRLAVRGKSDNDRFCEAVSAYKNKK
ncbi:aminotransferase class I/II-fold pyridoxal phosphate-dependent enzyme [Breznakiella homolactica]|uniref:Aminotransferase n=1 Tax=Breznakiella homolactica TaxID=2798577 RepID=A0A7T7XJV9_9SPIR|nr:aminotransferase class I/II-fold pyridoxal phosphate-dependent enzyme [Breznakiella homolactica]QQO07711.1 aminotransferase class I/II-fold pyridoxal phosphate-dependent enzyme [Breznakiella homolactica]